MPGGSTSGSDQQKRAAALRAAALVMPDRVRGLGSGSTAELVLEALAVRVSEGLRVVGIATSRRTEARARQLGLTVIDFADHRRIDLTLDGADEVERGTLNLVKGRGGALLREKIVAAASARMVAVVDETKLVDRLGRHVPLPVEINSFGWQVTLERLAATGAAPTLRCVGDSPFVTDSGNYIVDCAFPAIADPAALEIQLARTIGVVESGLFIGIAHAAVIGGRSGVAVMER
jgi:ribose 5-phosphate isomerase A